MVMFPNNYNLLLEKVVTHTILEKKLSLALPVPKSNYVTNSISYRAASLWSSLTNEHRTSNNIASFIAILRTDKS